MASRYVVEHLNHLGIVAEVCQEIGGAAWLDEHDPNSRQWVSDSRQWVSVGTATVALVLICTSVLCGACGDCYSLDLLAGDSLCRSDQDTSSLACALWFQAYLAVQSVVRQAEDQAAS